MANEGREEEEDDAKEFYSRFVKLQRERQRGKRLFSVQNQLWFYNQIKMDEPIGVPSMGPRAHDKIPSHIKRFGWRPGKWLAQTCLGHGPQAQVGLYWAESSRGMLTSVLGRTRLGQPAPICTSRLG